MAAAFILLPTVAVAQTQGSITFVVDENLAPIEKSNKYLFDGKRLANSILYGENIPKEAYRIVATSFADAQCMKSMGKDAFYQCIVQAYANPKSITLSPDMIWLLISQGFARYVNAHAEALRPQLVSHAGKMDLAIETQKDLRRLAGARSVCLDAYATDADGRQEIRCGDRAVGTQGRRQARQVYLSGDRHRKPRRRRGF